MADAAVETAPAAEAAPPPPAEKKGKGGFMRFLLWPMVIICGALLQKAFAFLVLAMIPVVMSYYGDRLPRKPYCFSVTALCMAAMFPFFMQIMTAQDLGYEAEHVMMQPSTWIIIYGSALIGWLITWSCPYVSHVIMSAYSKGRVTTLESQQKKMVEAWGKEIIRKPPEVPEES